MRKGKSEEQIVAAGEVGRNRRVLQPEGSKNTEKEIREHGRENEPSDVQSRLSLRCTQRKRYVPNAHLPKLFPKIVEADLLLHQLLATGNVLRDIAEQKIHQRASIFLRTHQSRLARDSD